MSMAASLSGMAHPPEGEDLVRRDRELGPLRQARVFLAAPRRREAAGRLRASRRARPTQSVV
jgi:hypothetical protein